jgi:hypothetical protein
MQNRLQAGLNVGAAPLVFQCGFDVRSYRSAVLSFPDPVLGRVGILT